MSENRKKKAFELKDEEIGKVSGGGGVFRVYHCENCQHDTIYAIDNNSTYCENCHVTGPAEMPATPHGR